MRWRLHAQRLLVEQAGQLDGAVIEKLKSLVADEQVDAIGLNVGAIHALSTLAAISASIKTRQPLD